MRRDISGWNVRWDEADAQRWVAEGKWLNRTLADAVREAARDQPQRVTQVCGGRGVTAGEIWEGATRLAGALQGHGLQAGDVVAFQTPNWHEAAFIDVACCLLGLVVCPIVTIYRDREVELILSDSRAKAIFIAENFRGHDFSAMLARIAPNVPSLQHVWTVRGASGTGRDLRDLIAGAAPLATAPEVSPDTVKLVLYTSGTTGRPKAVLHSHNSLIRATLMCAQHWGIRPGDTTLMPSPVTHVTGFSHGLEMPFYGGTRCVLMEKWDAAQAADTIDREQVVFTIGATPFLQELMDVAEAQQRTLPSLRLFPCGGAAVAPETIYRVPRVLPHCRAFRVYGSSEAPMITMGWCAPGQEKLAAETDGEIVDYEVRVVDADGRLAAPGQEGEICARGPALFLGYADAGHTAEAFDADGFFHTGDIGYVQDGAVVFTGRIKDLINRGGEKISAKEVEDLLHQHPAVQAAAVVAMPHARLGETVCAYVIARPGATVDAAGINALLDAASVARQKYPERYFFVDAFPSTASGKVKKDLLRKDALERCKR
ncbi:cyclohexanecarboxylate-CoA ligase [Pseudorhodoferax aquiterrae]|uniref:Cyclohexanecarboxylate-CoA ligase n=1 Tax=Pseudorhodoferax aquiterrae TaxID=747304 RepID=A0ABQ3FVC7_9BURK|nr:AMP-binding protein [Pseudorhodoferax aquiterrae]GHC69570.1 cyclohexanecarboxylate-CoA ligase [Pseudorhodoferax aquiterrae]